MTKKDGDVDMTSVRIRIPSRRLRCGSVGGVIASIGILAWGTMAGGAGPAWAAGTATAPSSLAAANAAGDGRTPEQLRREVLERLHTLRDWRIVDALSLDQAGAARLRPLLARYDEREMALAQERREIVRALRAEMEVARPDDGRVTAGIGRLLANRARRRTLEDERINELRTMLTPVQQVKLLLLLPRIDREFSQRVRDAIGGRRRPARGDDPAAAPPSR